MENATTSSDRIVIVIIAVLCAVALLAIVYYLGERRGRLRGIDAAKIRAGDRAFQTEQFGRVVTAILGENALRIKAEEDRLFKRNSGA